MSDDDKIWFQDHYILTKKVLTLWNKYYIQDASGRNLGFCKQKMFKLKEDLRIYTDENQTTELFRIKQQQIFDAWGKFAIVDSQSGAHLGYLKRDALKSGFVKDVWEMYDHNDRLIGKVSEKTWMGLLRKYVSNLIPEKMTLEINGQPIAYINQRFKIIGDIWDITCLKGARNIDRRVFLGAALLMGMIERSRK